MLDFLGLVSLAEVFPGEEGTRPRQVLFITLLSARGESGQCSRESLLAVGRI